MVAELNADDLLGQCLCTLMENMVKIKEERMELTEVIKQLMLLPAGRKILFHCLSCIKVCNEFFLTFLAQIVSSNKSVGHIRKYLDIP